MITTKLSWGIFLLGLDLIVKPSMDLFLTVGIFILIDLATGVLKAKMKKVARTSEGYRKTIIKVTQYSIPILAIFVAAKLIPEQKTNLNMFGGWLMMFIMYVEATSILENLYEIDSTSMIAKFLYRPILSILKLGIAKNPVTKAADELLKQKEVKDEKTT